MITLHQEKETNFELNGYGVLDDLIFNDGGSWEMNGEFKITFEVPVLTEFTKYLEARNIVQAPVPFMERQLFRIYRTEQTLTSIYVEARHIFYDLLDNWIEDTNIVGQVGNSAIQQLLSRTQYPHRFTATSNISKAANARIIRMNPVEAIIDDGKENTLVSRWGGELVRNNFHIEMLERMGADRGVRIEHKKDLMGYNATIDVSTIITRIHPVGFDGIELPEKYVDSPLIDLDHPIIAEVKYEDIKAAIGEYADDEEAVPLEQAYELLRQAAADEFAVNHVDEPETVVEVDFVALLNTEQYKDFADLQEVKAGDTVKVSAPDHGFEITSRLVGFEFSLLNKDHYTSTTLGNHVLEYTSSETDVNDLRERVEEAERTAVTAILAANGRNRNFYGAEDPNTLELDARLGDNYFLENGESYITYLFVEVNGERYWKRASLDEVALKNQFEDQQEEIETMKIDVDYSRSQLEQTIANAGFTDLDTAFNNVQTISNQAQTNAESAMQKAIDNASLIGGLDDSISSMSLAINDINNSLTLKANTTEINRIDNTITDINNELTFQSGELSSKVSQTVYNEAIGNLETTQTQLTQTFDNFETSVTGSDGRLTLAEQFLDGFRNTAFDPETGQLSLTEQTIAGLQDIVSDPVNGLETRVTTLAGAYDSTVSKIATWTETYSVNTANPLPLKDINGNNLTTDKSYDIILGVLGTGTVTYFSASLLSNNSSWTLEIHEQNGNSSNHPYIFLNENGYPMVGLYGHTSFYQVRATITEMGSRQKSSMSAMYDEINLRVQKDDLISQINIQADRTLIQTGKLLLDTETVVFGGDAFIPGAYIEDASIDTAKIADLSVSSAKIININVDKIVGNTSQFVRSAWEAAAGGSVFIEGEGITTIASDGSSSIIQNGAILAYQPNNAGIGYIGYSGSQTSPFYTITNAQGANFRIRSHMGGGNHQSDFEIYPSSNETYIRTDFTRITGVLVTSQRAMLGGTLEMGFNAITQVKDIDIAYAGYLRPDTSGGSYLYRPALFGNNGVSLGVGTSSSFSRKMMIDSTRIYMYQPLNMQGNGIFEQSDERYKTNIKEYTESSLDIIKPLRFITYEYTGENMASGIMFGLIAQESGAFGEYDSENDMWGINTSKQIMHNTHGIQELAIAHENIVALASKAYLKAESNEERIERLEAELKQLKGAS